MAITLNLKDNGKALELLESVSEATEVRLPSGKKLVMWPEERLAELSSVLSDPDFRKSLEHGIKEAQHGQLEEIDPDKLT